MRAPLFARAGKKTIPMAAGKTSIEFGPGGGAPASERSPSEDAGAPPPVDRPEARHSRRRLLLRVLAADGAFAPRRLDLVGGESEHVAHDLGGVFAEQGRAPDLGR